MRWIMQLVRWGQALGSRLTAETVSPAWLEAHEAAATKVGWEGGPVWRSPKERAQMKRQELRKQRVG